MIVTGKVLGLNVAPSSADYHQGKKGRQSGRYYSGGSIHVKNGFGGQLDLTPKRLTLLVEVGGIVFDVWVDCLFRSEIGKLTPRRTKAICESVPDETANAIREGTFAFISPVITSTDGRCVAITRCIPAARASCDRRTMLSSTSL